MASHREPNPLRPYYTPPSIGEGAGRTYQNSSGAATAQHATSSINFGSSARDIVSDIDYTNYISDTSAGAASVVKGLLEQAIWKYSSVLLAQPFEVAKLVLQVQLQDHKLPAGRQREELTRIQQNFDRRRPSDSYDDLSSDSDLDSPGYFTSSTPLHQGSPQRTRGRRRKTSYSPSGSPPAPSKRLVRHVFELTSNSSVLAAISTIWDAEGAWGIWKGTNCSFVYSILSSTITSFIRSILAALLALPDPGLSFTNTSVGPSSATGGLDILSSPSPLTSLTIAVSAAGVSGIILAPLDLARTKLVLTPANLAPRSIIATIRSLPTWGLPATFAFASILNSTLSSFFSAFMPLFFRSNMKVDPVLTPTLYTATTFFSQLLEIGVKWPVETVLRRAQINFLSDQHSIQATRQPRFETVVKPGPYKGLFGTMRVIMFEEGKRDGASKEASQLDKTMTPRSAHRQKKGQGIEGLYRGWRIGMWGILGVWGATALGGTGQRGGEF